VPVCACVRWLDVVCACLLACAYIQACLYIHTVLFIFTDTTFFG